MKYLYTPFDIAAYLAKDNLTINEEQIIFDKLWNNRTMLLIPGKCQEQKDFRKLVQFELLKLV